MSKAEDKFSVLTAEVLGTMMTQWGFERMDTQAGTVRYANDSVTVDLRYGPPEFHVELLLRTRGSGGSKAYTLADLIRKDCIANWMQENRLRVGSEDSMEAEIRWYQRFLSECCEGAMRGERKFFGGL